MKKISTLVLMLMCAIATWAYDFQVDGLCYNVLPGKDNRVEVTFQYNTVANYSDLTNVTIPNEVTYDGVTYRVTKVGEKAFALATGLESIVMGDQVDTICAYSFNACTSLGSVSIGAKLRYIDKNTFNNCVIKSVHWNAEHYYEVTWDDPEWSPFYPYRKIITSFTFGDSVQSIPEYLCEGLSKITTIVIPKNLRYTRGHVFGGCTSVTSIEWNAINYDDMYEYLSIFDEISTQITSFTIGDSVSRLPYRICESMTNLTAVSIPNSVTDMGGSVFYGCTSLREVQLSDSLSAIGYGAFSGCTALENINIPKALKEIEYGAFRNCSSLVSIEIPKTVESIEHSAFAGCTSLSAIELPDGLKQIDEHVFEDCASLKKMTIPQNVNAIGSHAFARCSSLQTVVLSDSLRAIEEGAFEDCVALTSITLPDSVTRLGRDVFMGCTNLSDISIPANCNYIGSTLLHNTAIYNDENNWKNDMLCFDQYLLEVKETISGEVSIPYGIRLIAAGTFSWDADITSVTIPSSVDVICDLVFAECRSLKSVTMTNSVRSLGGSAFDGCTSLTEVKLSDYIEAIEESTFEDCEKLVSINLPKSLKTIGEYAFDGCESLASVEFPDNMTYIDSYAFYFCESLESIEIPDSVTVIANFAFYGCESLSTVTIGKSVHWIGNRAFDDCDNLSTVYLRAATPPGLGYWADYAPISSSPMCFVPCGTKEVYMAHEGWSEIASSFEEFVVADVREGACGKEVTWQYDQGKMTIQGTGAITFNCLPWEMLIDSITSVEIGEGVTSIPARAFTDCKKLIKLTLPSTVDEIGGDAFAGCPRLYEIHCKALIPPLAEESTFTNYNAKLYIPCESMDYYQADLVFSKFTNIECLNTAVEDVVVPDTDGRKFLQDGQLLIHHEGKTYNILGKSL